LLLWLLSAAGRRARRSGLRWGLAGRCASHRGQHSKGWSGVFAAWTATAAGPRGHWIRMRN